MAACHVANIIQSFVLINVALAMWQVQIGGILIYLQKLIFFK